MSNRTMIGRREFLAVSTASAVATAVLGPNLFAAGLAGGAPRRLAIGYASVDDAAVAPASSISAADGGFIGHGARITVTRMSGPALAPRERRAVSLRAHFSYLDGAERKLAPFEAWGCSRANGCEGSAAAFTYPVDEVQKIALSFKTESGAPGGAASRRETFTGDTTVVTELPFVLSLRDEAGTLKLARGFYIIVPLFENDGEPRWTAYQLGDQDGHRMLVDRDSKVAPFEHFVLNIDYAA
ncbi:MAG TPA: hypothetical protein VM733_21390 [Thermoanaerobaculia bacterium]|nr:hypothetical protein [Thermoanaerobaculia bacterium]